jgi:hypothetical protein
MKEMDYLPVVNPDNLFCQDLERIFSKFIFVLFIMMPFCGQTFAQTPQMVQNRVSIDEWPSVILIALHGQRSWQAWHESPLQIISSSKLLTLLV